MKTLTWIGTVPRNASGETTLTVMGNIDGMASRAPVTFLLTNKLALAVQPTVYNGLAAVLHNPSGDSFRGTLRVSVGRRQALGSDHIVAAAVRPGPELWRIARGRAVHACR